MNSWAEAKTDRCLRFAPHKPISFFVIHRTLARIERLLRICRLPSGPALKWSEPAFSLMEFETCQALAAGGIHPKLVIDAGANIGQFALAATCMLQPEKVISFEPVSSAYTELLALSKRYPCIEPRHLALGSKREKTVIRVATQTRSSSILPLHENHRTAYPLIHQHREEEIIVTTLLDEIPADKYTPILLKLDVQGFELEVLKGGGDLPGIQWMLVECSSIPYYEGAPVLRDLQAHLEPLGFSIQYPVASHRTGTDGPVQQFDLLFARA